MPLSSEPDPNNNCKYDGPINKKRACATCHLSKQRCHWSTADQKKCDRCIRLNKDCVAHISRQGQRPKKASEDAPKDYSTGRSNSSASQKNITQSESGKTCSPGGNGDLKLPAMDRNGNNVPSAFKPDAAAWNMSAPFTRHITYSDGNSPQTCGQNIQPNLLAASMPNPANLLADQQRMILLQRQLLSNYYHPSSIPFAGHHDPTAISRENTLAVLKSSIAFQGNPTLARNFLQTQPQTLTTQVLVEQLQQLEKKKLELNALKHRHDALKQGNIPGAQFDIRQEASSNISAGLDKSDDAQAQSRLKKKKKAHLLDLDLVHVGSESEVVNHPANDKKRSVDMNEVSFGDAPLKKTKQDESATNRSLQEILKPPPAEPSLQSQVLDSDINFVRTLTK
eukprot:scaffold961_cov35-Cyclotella_meneghiniana.AAC.3